MTTNPLIATMTLLTLTAASPMLKSQTAPAKRTYVSVPNDPFALRMYTLNNGLKVYISENHSQPRVQTNIAVRTGSKQDPADATGLAHYLEHMLFKGTSNLGALNWEEESKLLNLISDEYELLRKTKDEAERKKIYHRIDSVSNAAAKFVAANEYDKLISSLGAQGTNAYTSNERTVYINDIPSSELEKWLAIESERFSELVLRLFHTELEAVYEEFNRGQDSDSRQAYYKTMELLFPNHPYGQQTTIGTGEHLKNPSMVKIHDYFQRRYAPNNMAIVLAGDVDPEATVALVEKYFGKFEARTLETIKMPKEAPINAPVIADVTGSEAEFEMIAFRLDGAKSKDELYAELLDGILTNGTAGLIDINLVQSQRVLKARSSHTINEDYGWFMLTGNVRDGQTLEEVRGLLLSQLDSVKQGKFDEWMIPAVIRKSKKDLMQQMEANWIRAYIMSDAFILDKDWNSVVDHYDRMSKITKADLVAWTKEKFGNNYVAVNKRLGEKQTHKVDKPEITQVSINREQNSSFFTHVNAMPSSRLTPQFIDYKTAIQSSVIHKNVPLNYVQNNTNELFYLYYVLDMGKTSDPKLPLALEYLPLLGTDKMTPAQVQRELFRLGLEFNVNTGDDQCYISLTGLKETFGEGVQFFENFLSHVVANQYSYDEFVKGQVKQRNDAKLNKGKILFSGMASYAIYGSKNPFNTVMASDELAALNPEELTNLLHELLTYEHRLMFYGPQTLKEATAILTKKHSATATLKPVPAGKKFEQIATTENRVYFTNYDMVQTELMMMHRGSVFNASLLPQSRIFSEYFGGGLSSIVFQEIRESRALAYSAYAGFNTPAKKDEHHYVRGYIGTQSNKLGDATTALLELMSTLPRADQQFEQARIGALKTIESTRTYGQNILWSYESAQKRGLDYDINESMYKAINTMTFDNLQTFFNEHVKDKKYSYLVIGKRSDMDMDALTKLGTLEELSLDQIFGY